MSWDRPGLHSGGVSPERIGISGVLWSTLWGCVCVQLRKIHGHSSLFRLQQSGRKGQQLLAQTDMLDEDKQAQKPSTRAHGGGTKPHCSACRFGSAVSSSWNLRAKVELRPRRRQNSAETRCPFPRVELPDSQLRAATRGQAPNELQDVPFTNNTTQPLSADGAGRPLPACWLCREAPDAAGDGTDGGEGRKPQAGRTAVFSR